MNTVNNSNSWALGTVIAVAMAAWLPLTAIAADEPMKPMKGAEHQIMVNTSQKADATPAEGKTMMQSTMTVSCQTMMGQKAKMMTDMKAQDAALTAQVAEMNRAPADKKMNLMAAVVTQMVEQQTAMNARKANMDETMMQHMMQHMQMGKESMSQCPMMKGMKSMDETSGDASKEQK